MQPFSFCFLFFVVGRGRGGDFGSGSGSKFNCAARVGSGQTISGTGRVRASVLSPCRPLAETPRPELGVSDKGEMQTVQCWGGGGGISGRVRALNLTVPHGSGRVRRSWVRAGFGLQF